MAEQSRSLYSVIPARVRDDRGLRPNAKLLYGELSSLAQAEGYCWATNAYLAELFGLSAKTVEGLIHQLKVNGHIRVEVERSEETNEVITRKIWICGPPGSVVPPPLKNEGTSPQNQGDPPLKNEGKNNINIIYNTPYSPPEGDEAVTASLTASTASTAPSAEDKPKRRRRSSPLLDGPVWEPERFAGFWRLYPRKVSKQAAIRAWDRLRPDDGTIAAMGWALLRQIRSEEWQRDGGRYIPHPSTWLNQARWTDETGGPVGDPPDGGGDSGVLRGEGVTYL